MTLQAANCLTAIRALAHGSGSCSINFCYAILVTSHRFLIHTRSLTTRSFFIDMASELKHTHPAGGRGKPELTNGVAGDPAPRPFPDDREASKSPQKNMDGPQHVTGMKLKLIMLALILACFLMLLDTSVIATVSSTRIVRNTRLLTAVCSGHSSNN